MLRRSTASPQDVSQLVTKWLQVDACPDSRSLIQNLQREGRNEELLDRLGSSLQFGTAGLRGLDGPGFNRMNRVTVQQTSQGVCQHLMETFGAEEVQRRGVVVGFDGRRNSRAYADVVAKVFLTRGVPVHLFSDVVPTPFVAFAITHLRCLAGVMVTASHNPKEYNGYKLYWENGCQIIPPQDSAIAKKIEESLDLWDLPESMEGLENLLQDPLGTVSQEYCTSIVQTLKFRGGEENSMVPKIVYSPLHGVGSAYVRQVFQSFGIQSLVVVPEQEHPDPEFPTVVFPNPEEGSGVFNLGFNTAEEAGATIVVINDPDADRLSAAEKLNGEWRVFTGNEIGLLLGDWMWQSTREHCPDLNPAQFAMINTVVSSKMLARLARQEGFQFHQTLTGFKWLGNKALDLRKEGTRVLLAFEEAIGFMLEGPVADKDGVSASVVFGEMAGALYAKGITIAEHLETITQSLGTLEYRSGYFKRTPEESRAFFQGLRGVQGYPSHLGSFAVTWVRDMGTGLDTSRVDGKVDLPWKKGDLMLTFGLHGDGWVTIRASGTEPKLKYYLEVGDSENSTASQAADELVRVIEAWVL